MVHIIDSAIKMVGVLVSVLTLYFVWTGAFIFRAAPGLYIILFTLPILLIFLMNIVTLDYRVWSKRKLSIKHTLYLNSLFILIYGTAFLLQSNWLKEALLLN